MGAADPHDHERFGLERVVFFSDAVFAIAITLLALDVRISEPSPPATDASLASAFGGALPRLFAYGLSFAVVGLFWFAHWRRFQLIDRIDGTVVGLNLLLLGFIALIPFPTAVMGAHGDLRVALVAYVSVLSLAGVTGAGTVVYAARRGLLRPTSTQVDVRLAIVRALAVPLVMGSSLVLLPFVPTFVVEDSWLLILPFQILAGRWARRVRKT